MRFQRYQRPLVPEGYIPMILWTVGIATFCAATLYYILTAEDKPQEETLNRRPLSSLETTER